MILSQNTPPLIGLGTMVSTTFIDGGAGLIEKVGVTVAGLIIFALVIWYQERGRVGREKEAREERQEERDVLRASLATLDKELETRNAEISKFHDWLRENHRHD